MSTDDARLYREGRRRLRNWLAVAELEADKAEGETTFNALGSSVQPHLRVSNLDAVVIYPAPKGGWHADVVLKSVPPGVPNSLGTPVGSPCSTQAEAEDVGLRLVTICVLQDRRNRDAPVTPAPGPVFLLFDYVFTLTPLVLEAAAKHKPATYTIERAGEHVREQVEAAQGRGFSIHTLNDWPDEVKGRLVAALHVAAATGLFAYPPRTDQSPEGVKG